MRTYGVRAGGLDKIEIRKISQFKSATNEHNRKAFPWCKVGRGSCHESFFICWQANDIARLIFLVIEHELIVARRRSQGGLKMQVNIGTRKFRVLFQSQHGKKLCLPRICAPIGAEFIVGEVHAGEFKIEVARQQQTPVLGGRIPYLNHITSICGVSGIAVVAAGGCRRRFCWGRCGFDGTGSSHKSTFIQNEVSNRQRLECAPKQRV